jgi:hypothetical protein
MIRELKRYPAASCLFDDKFTKPKSRQNIICNKESKK